MRTDVDRPPPDATSQGTFSTRPAEEARGRIPGHLTRSFAEEILSRLALRVPRVPETPASRGTAADGRNVPDAAAIDRLCDALICDDPRRGAEMIQAAHAAGASPDTIYMCYIAAAAMRLGERWVADTATFFEVTLGLSRLHGILRDFRPEFLGEDTNAVDGCTALLAPVPGETHVLGVTIAADYFRRAGWQVDLGTSASLDIVVAAARRFPYAIIGLSASSRQMIGTLGETIVALRSARPGTAIVVGGHIGALEPDIAAMVGADSVVGDASSAAVELRRFARTGN